MLVGEIQINVVCGWDVQHADAGLRNQEAGIFCIKV